MRANPRAGLNRHTIIETALQVLDEVGLDGLTVRRLAAELGVQSPALYWHVRNKQELLDGMAEAILAAGGAGPPREDERWQDWLTHRARRRRKALLAHRDGARLVVNTPGWARSPMGTRMFDESLTALVDRGFTPVLALRTITTVWHYINGFVLQEQTERQEKPRTPSDPLTALAERLDAGTSGTLIAALRDGGDPLGEQAFEEGLQTLIDGTTAALAGQHSGHQS